MINPPEGQKALILATLEQTEIDKLVEEALEKASIPTDHPLAHCLRGLLKRDHCARLSATDVVQILKPLVAPGEMVVEEVPAADKIVAAAPASPSSSSSSTVIDGPMCSEHNLSYRYFCPGHNCLCCMDCFAFNHNKCTMESIADGQARKNKEFHAFLDASVQSSQKLRRERIELTAGVCRQIEEAKATNLAAISALESQLQSALKERMQALRDLAER